MSRVRAGGLFSIATISRTDPHAISQLAIVHRIAALHMKAVLEGERPRLDLSRHLNAQLLEMRRRDHLIHVKTIIRRESEHALD